MYADDVFISVQYVALYHVDLPYHSYMGCINTLNLNHEHILYRGRCSTPLYVLCSILVLYCQVVLKIPEVRAYL